MGSASDPWNCMSLTNPFFLIGDTEKKNACYTLRCIIGCRTKLNLALILWETTYFRQDETSLKNKALKKAWVSNYLHTQDSVISSLYPFIIWQCPSTDCIAMCHFCIHSKFRLPKQQPIFQRTSEPFIGCSGWINPLGALYTLWKMHELGHFPVAVVSPEVP